MWSNFVCPHGPFSLAQSHIYIYIYIYVCIKSLGHLRLKGFTSVYFTYKSVVREISRYIPDIPDHKSFDTKAVQGIYVT